MTKNTNRPPYLRGYQFWKKNKFWLSIPGLSAAGLKYYEDWLHSLKANDKHINKENPSLER